MDWVHAAGFTPYPEDQFGAIYGIDEEELDEDLVLAILEHVNVRPPTIEEMAPYGPVDTPAQVARLVKAARKFESKWSCHPVTVPDECSPTLRLLSRFPGTRS